MAVKLSGTISDITTRPLEDVSQVTVKSAHARPSAAGITVTQPSRVNVGEDGNFTVTATEGVKGWIYVEGPGWSDTIPFIAAVGMTTMWQAIVNSFPITSDMRAYLNSLEDARNEVRRALTDALKTVDSSVQDAIKSKLWYQGYITSEQDLNELTTAGYYSVESSIAAKGMKNAPDDESALTLAVVTVLVSGKTVEQTWSTTNTVKREDFPVYRRTRDIKGTWCPWQRIDHGTYWLSNDDDLNQATTPGLYLASGWSRVKSLKNTPPVPAQSAANVEVIPVGGGRLLQRWVAFGTDGITQMWQRLLSSTGDWLPWQDQTQGTVPDTPTAVFAHGDSQVGANYAWPTRMENLPYTVTNYGSSGSTPDEVLLRNGVIEVPIPAMELAPGESRRLAWERPALVRQNRNTSYVITIGEDLATLTFDVASNSWLISSKQGLVVPAPAVGHTLRRSKYENARHIVWFGGNAIRNDIHHPDETLAEHVEMAYARAIKFFGPETIVCGYAPAYGDEDGAAVADELNAWLARVVPTQFLDMRRRLQVGAPEILGRALSEQDQSDIAAGWLPRGMYREDGVHLTDETHQWIARLIASYPEGATSRLAIGTATASYAGPVDVEWRGDRLVINGEVGPSLSGPAGKNGTNGKDGAIKFESLTQAQKDSLKGDVSKTQLDTAIAAEKARTVGMVWMVETEDQAKTKETSCQKGDFIQVAQTGNIYKVV